MGRSIIAEEYVEKYIEKLLKENKWYTGVIIGQVDWILFFNKRDYRSRSLHVKQI